MAENSVVAAEDAEMPECEGEKVVTMMDVLQEQQDFEDDANAVLGASDEKECTYSKGYIKRQAVYACLTCCSDTKTDETKRAGVCLACSLLCHENHELVELYTKRNFRCDCGNPKLNTNPCQFTPNKTELNEDNIYNQNFSGLYCVCHRPYPDPEINDEDEMIQCIVCEDWLHAAHLEAEIPSPEHYAEMICKPCMEKNEFLHDYTEFAVNSIENGDVDVVNVSIVSNGLDEITGEDAKPDEGQEKPADVDMSSSEDKAVDSVSQDNAVNSASEDKAVDSVSLDKALDSASEDKIVDNTETLEETSKEESKESESLTETKEPELVPNSEKQVAGNDTAEAVKEAVESSITESKVEDKPEPADNVAPESNGNQDVSTESEPKSNEISDDKPSENISNDASREPSKEETGSSVPEPVKETPHTEEKMDTSNTEDVNTKDESSDKVTETDDKPIEVSAEDKVPIANGVENKRKLSVEDSEAQDTPKKAKLDKCVRPKGGKRVLKGAAFWPSNFREKLCTCTECLTMYKDLAVLFLTDAEDTVTAYETLGKERTEGVATTQYEKGLEALSSLDRIQQINALTEYNKMRDKLLDFLKSFKDRKEVVKEEDIKAFFAGMKPKRESDGVYFCR